MARMSSSVIRGFERTFSNSSSLRVIGNCWMLKESAPAWLRIARFTDAFRPWISDTTAMIDVTATMLPRTVMKDRSLADQIASRAISADSAKLRIGLVGQVGRVRQVGRIRRDISQGVEQPASASPAGVCGRSTYQTPPTHPTHPSYLALFVLSTFTRSPSGMARTDLFGSVITWAPYSQPARSQEEL